MSETVENVTEKVEQLDLSKFEDLKLSNNDLND